MAKDIYEENKELKRALYKIEKAVLEFRLTQLDLPLEKVNAPSLGLPSSQVQTVPYTLTTCSCVDGEGCNCDEEKEVLREQVESLKAQLAKYENKETAPKAEEEIVDYAPSGFPGDDGITGFPEDDEEDPVDYMAQAKEEVANFTPLEEAKKVRKPRKERGGTVFTDFKTLSLDNNDYEGNSIVYSKKDVQ